MLKLLSYRNYTHTTHFLFAFINVIYAYYAKTHAKRNEHERLNHTHLRTYKYAIEFF